jgi:CHAT domain-containing protein
VLYNLLVAPVAGELPSDPGALLTIIPHGQLVRVAFPALIDNRGNYLIEHYTVHSIPAVGVLRYTAENDRLAAQHPAHYVLLANPAHFPILSAGLRLPPLPATEKEVKGAARLLPSDQVTLLDGEKAGIVPLEKTLQEATVLHFATHAIVSDTDPFASFLALDKDSQNGELTAAQIYGWNIHAKLVVLSACRTGLGKITGDGVAGLSRAFFASGAASVLSTLWDVADEPTARLLPRFYRELSSGSSRAAALRTAQLSLIADLRRGKVSVNTPGGKVVLPEEPLFWAAFSLSGEP